MCWPRQPSPVCTNHGCGIYDWRLSVLDAAASPSPFFCLWKRGIHPLCYFIFKPVADFLFRSCKACVIVVSSNWYSSCRSGRLSPRDFLKQVKTKLSGFHRSPKWGTVAFQDMSLFLLIKYTLCCTSGLLLTDRKGDNVQFPPCVSNVNVIVV